MDKHIAEREEQIASLQRLIDHLRRKQRSTATAQQLLDTMLAAQTLSIAHRNTIALLVRRAG
jgi:hypothetical protein